MTTVCPELNSAAAAELWPRLVRSARRYCRRPEEAEDAAQQALLRLLESPPPAGVGVEAWVMRVARNAAIDNVRRGAARRRRDRAAAAHERASDPPPRPASVCIVRCVEALPVEQRDLLHAIDVNGTRASDLARAADVPTSTLKSRARRARDQVRRCFDTCCAADRDARGVPVGEPMQVANQAACG